VTRVEQILERLRPAGAPGMAAPPACRPTALPSWPPSSIQSSPGLVAEQEAAAVRRLAATRLDPLADRMMATVRALAG
jgi:hypothetical protein